MTLTPLQDDALVLIVATSLEYKALRRALPSARIVLAGIGLSNLKEPLGSRVLSCGVAGGLRADLETGTLLIPREVRRPDGSTMRCDDELVQALLRAARSLGVEPVTDPLLTSDTIVNGKSRGIWAERGYAGVDMETGRIAAPRVAAVRVVLDTPVYELSSDWSRPMLAILRPKNWAQARWLAREAPRAAGLAGRVVAATQGIAEWVQITRQ